MQKIIQNIWKYEREIVNISSVLFESNFSISQHSVSLSVGKKLKCPRFHVNLGTFGPHKFMLKIEVISLYEHLSLQYVAIPL